MDKQTVEIPSFDNIIKRCCFYKNCKIVKKLEQENAKLRQENKELTAEIEHLSDYHLGLPWG